MKDRSSAVADCARAASRPDNLFVENPISSVITGFCYDTGYAEMGPCTKTPTLAMNTRKSATSDDPKSCGDRPRGFVSRCGHWETD